MSFITKQLIEAVSSYNKGLEGHITSTATQTPAVAQTVVPSAVVKQNLPDLDGSDWEQPLPKATVLTRTTSNLSTDSDLGIFDVSAFRDKEISPPSLIRTASLPIESENISLPILSRSQSTPLPVDPDLTPTPVCTCEKNPNECKNFACTFDFEEIE